VTYPGCPRSELVAAGGRELALDGPMADALAAYASASGGNRGPRTPSLIGLSLAAAEAAASRAGLSVSLSGAVSDARVPFGSVIFQSLQPGAASRLRNGPQARVVVAIGPEPACRARQLWLTYRGLGTSGGSDFGAIAIGDVGRAPCTLSGFVTIAGLDYAGRPVTNAFRSRFAGTVTLSPREGSIVDGARAPDIIPPPPAALTGAIWLTQVYRYRPNSPAGTSCRPRWIIPAAWRVALPGGFEFTVANTDRRGSRPIVPSGAFVTCEGHLDDATLLYYGQPVS